MKKILIFIFNFFIMCFLCAQENPSIESDSQNKEFNLYSDSTDIPVITQQGRETDSFQNKFFNMLFILGLLIAFMILASWALKRMMKSKITQLNTASSIKILETRPLSPRATLHLIEVDDKTFLIGESPTTLTYLSEIHSKENAQ